MKKIIFALSTILIVTFCAYTIKCQDVLIKINQLKTYGQDIIVNKIIYDDESKANEEKNQTEKIINMELNNVRIVLMNSDFSSIYHNNIEIKKKEKININYGKDFQNSEIVNEDKMEDIKDALQKLKVNGMTISQVMGCGTQMGYREKIRGYDVDINVLPKVKFEIVVSSQEWADRTIDAICKCAHTGEHGDGKIFVYELADVIRIRTGEHGPKAVWAADQTE